MADVAHMATDEALDALERCVRSVYSRAQKDVSEKMNTFTEHHKAKDAVLQQQLKDGKITEEQYKQWLRGQVFQGDRWQAQLNDITTTLNNSNKVAQGIINSKVSGIFAENANWTAYTIEHGLQMNFGFGIYDESTVASLLRDEPNLLPRKTVNIRKDLMWNKRQIAAQITQGIIQGESLDKVSKRLQTVTNMNRNTALTNARTAMTGAENAGRQESYNRAAGMGIKIKKTWVATLDSHTRDTHSALDGQSVDINKPFTVGFYSIAYPGDPNAAPTMVYNCRCTMVADTLDYPDENAKRYDNIAGKPIKNMTYSQWKTAKKLKEVQQEFDSYMKAQQEAAAKKVAL